MTKLPAVQKGLKWHIVVVAAGMVALIMIGCGERQEGTTRSGAQPVEKRANLSRTSSGENVITLAAETQRLAGLVIVSAEAATLRPEVKAYGKVLDPVSLVTLHGDVLAAEAALTNSAAQLQRTRTLFQEDQNASRRALDTAEAEFRSNEVRFQVAKSQLNLEWGDGIAGLDVNECAKLIAQLVNHQAALLRVDLPIGEGNLAKLPASARVMIAGLEDKFFDARVLSVAPAANEKMPGQGFLLRVDSQDASLRPGTAVSVFLPLPGNAQSGVTIPRSSLVRLAGNVWVYVQLDADKFTRRQVVLTHPTDAGWFVKEGVHPGDKLVVEGVEELLSEELKSQIHISE